MCVEFWSPLGLGWIASAIGKPTHLCPRTAKMENIGVAQICVEIDADASFPTRIILKSSSDPSSFTASESVENVEYSWMPTSCSHCQLFGHGESNCKYKKLVSSAGKSHRSRAMQLNHSPHIGSLVNLQKVAVDSECSTKPLAPLRADCDADLVEGMDIQCPQSAEQLAVDGLAMPPVSCSLISANSLGLDAITMVNDPEHPKADPGDQMVQHRCEANETLYSTPSDHAPDLLANYHPKSIGCQVSYVEALRSGIQADGIGSLGTRDAPMSHCPILDTDRLESLGLSDCLEVGVELAKSSSVHNALFFPQGGVQCQCTNSEQLCGSLVSQCKADSGALVDHGAVPPRVSGRDTLGDGLKLKSIIEKPKRPKLKRSPPANHHP